MKRHATESGAIDGWIISTIGLIVVTLGISVVAIWAFMNYTEQKTGVDDKISSAVSAAKKTQSDADAAKFADQEKQPNRDFVGPDNYGRVTFSYPKTWSAFEATDVTRGGTYQAYLHPGVVPPISGTQQYALEVKIEEKDYDQVVQSYDGLVKAGKLRSSPVTANGENGTRLDGNFTNDIRGAAVIFRIRDKTLTLKTDADTFKPDFENIVPTLKYNS